MSLLALAMVAGCKTFEQEPYPGNEAAGSMQGPAFVLQPGDQVKIDLLYHPEFGRTTTIRADGYGTAPFLGQVMMAGKDMATLTRELETDLEKHLKDTKVQLDLETLALRAVYVAGEVESPGVVSIDGSRLDLSQAIARAGWVKPTADLENVIVARERGLDGRKSWKVNLAGLFEERDPGRRVLLREGDLVLVPTTDIADVDLFVEQYLIKTLPWEALTIGALFATR